VQLQQVSAESQQLTQMLAACSEQQRGWKALRESFNNSRISTAARRSRSTQGVQAD